MKGAQMEQQEITDFMKKLQSHGYVVIVWTPDEIGEADAEKLESESIKFGHDLLWELNNHT